MTPNFNAKTEEAELLIPSTPNKYQQTECLPTLPDTPSFHRVYQKTAVPPKHLSPIIVQNGLKMQGQTSNSKRNSRNRNAFINRSFCQQQQPYFNPLISNQFPKPFHAARITLRRDSNFTSTINPANNTYFYD